MDLDDLAVLEKVLERLLAPIIKLQEEHHRTLFGDGSDGNQGLRVDVDRVKQDRRRGDAHFWVIYPIIAGLFLSRLWEWVQALFGGKNVPPN